MIRHLKAILTYVIPFSVVMITSLGVCRAFIAASVNHDFGMVDGIFVGGTLAASIFILLERSWRMRLKKANEKLDKLCKEALICYDLAKSFTEQGNTEAAAQFLGDYEEKRMEFFKVAGSMYKGDH